MDNTTQLFGDKLKQKREESGLTQGELAALAGVSVAAVNRFECNEVVPKRMIIERLALALEISPRTFLEKPRKN